MSRLPFHCEVIILSEQDKRQVGDGGTNYAEALRHTADAVHRAGTEAAGEAAKAAADAGRSAAAGFAVQAGAEGGTAVAGAAAGTAAGGPVGAALAAVWALRKPIYKAMICLLLVIVFFVTAMISLPSILFSTASAAGSDDLMEAAHDLADVVADCIRHGYDLALAEVEGIIDAGGYDYELSMDALINHGSALPEYDICFILAAYSVSMEQKDATPEDMRTKLLAVAPFMFGVTYDEKTYEGTELVPDGESGDPDALKEIPKTYHYVECTIHPFDQDCVLEAFALDMDAAYGPFGVTCAEAIETMIQSLRATIFGGASGGAIPELADVELLALIDGLNCSATRKELVKNALSLVGRVPYFWGGKSKPGWNDDWNEMRTVTASGSPSTGTSRPYGLDCSGLTDWAYKTTGLGSIGSGSASQWDNSSEINESQLLPGDLGFKAKPGDPGVNHVLLYVGRAEDGSRLWVHCSSSAGGVVVNSPDYVKYFRRPDGVDLESATPPAGGSASFGTPKYTLRVQVTHYCACKKCCGKDDGITASGKQAAPGMVAMSSHYSFGTKLEIDGKLYTVQDRGGKSIENDITRVDIFVPDHQEALRLGRFWTEATFY